MISILSGYPDDVLAISCEGTVTADDYRNSLIPEINKRLKNKRSVCVLCVIGDKFDGYTPGAAWADFAFGISHWNEFERLAVVTDVGWIRNAIALFTPLFHPMRSFQLSELEAAKKWIVEKDKPVQHGPKPEQN